ncbi:hypothetical protein G6O67_003390 [Ophiocordyceps sinensis]|uniref:Uncharacterized protein n=1 Tax=Ophiocordyceps sinensis TaxID=72228 RepID=A0A8H4V896_9HYPO|nr:hypothetical protein G6O67_003390 [Ophiocordyceps sinensis]
MSTVNGPAPDSAPDPADITIDRQTTSSSPGPFPMPMRMLSWRDAPVAFYCSYFIHTQIQWEKATKFAFVNPSSGTSSLPLRFSLAACTVLLKSSDLSGPHSEKRKPCFRIL